jgi:hypothetical protein
LAVRPPPCGYLTLTTYRRDQGLSAHDITHSKSVARTLADRRNAAEKLIALRAGTASRPQNIEPAPAAQPAKPQRLKLYAEEE